MDFGIWNHLDEMGLYLNISRLEYETDEDFYTRIKKFSKWKFKTDYYTLAHSVPLQLGLDTVNMLEITTVNGKRFVCDINWEYFTLESFNDDGSSSEYIRIYINTHATTVQKVLDIINTSSIDFQYIIYNSSFNRYPFKNIIRNTNTFMYKDYISNKASNLSNKNIIKKTLRSNNNSVINREVSSLLDLKKKGDYFVDYENGYIETYSIIDGPIDISYQYYTPRFILEYTDVNLIPVNVIAKYGITDDLIDMIPFILANQTWGA
jgi:arsenate reductase-like glutaredoxin family protein